MSRPQQPPPTDLFGFSSVGMGPSNLAVADFSNLQPAADGEDAIYSMLERSTFDTFHGLPLSFDDDNTMAQPFEMSAPPATQPALPQPSSSDSGFPSGTAEETAAGHAPVGRSLPAAAFGGLLGANTLTEFTKRRNWPAKVVEEMKDSLQILDGNGKVKHVSPNITALTGYEAQEIQDKFLKDFIHPDDQGVFFAELNESIASGTPFRLFYRMRKKDGNYMIFEAVGHAHIAAARFASGVINNQSPFCQAVFMMARSYPTKNTSLLDSFLEHKIENERLKRRIAELRREEEHDVEDAQRTWQQNQEGRSEIAPSEDTMVTGSTGTAIYLGGGADSTMAAPPERDGGLSNTALTRENLEGVAGSRPDSIREKMARFEGPSHADTIEMLTGLRYQEGERSRGITTGNASPALIRGDAGIAMPMDRDRSGDKKKKLKVTEEYVCTDCGTLDSPEWRRGPSGPKSLCNACGLRWAKKEKKRVSDLKVEGGGGDDPDTSNLMDTTD